MENAFNIENIDTFVLITSLSRAMMLNHAIITEKILNWHKFCNSKAETHTSWHQNVCWLSDTENHVYRFSFQAFLNLETGPMTNQLLLSLRINESLLCWNWSSKSRFASMCELHFSGSTYTKTSWLCLWSPYFTSCANETLTGQSLVLREPNCRLCQFVIWTAFYYNCHLWMVVYNIILAAHKPDSLLLSAVHVCLEPHPGHATKVTTWQHCMVSAVERHNTGKDGRNLWCLPVKQTQK